MSNRLTGEELDRRLNTISVNAIREAQVALGRGDQPWIDDDFRRQRMIAEFLKLHEVEDSDRAAEHYPLVAHIQAPSNPAVDAAYKTLADTLNVGLVDDEPVIATPKHTKRAA